AATAFHFPFVYQHSASSSGTALGIGPLDGLFQMRTGVLLQNPPPPLLVHLRELDLQLQRAQWITGLQDVEGVEMPDDPEGITTALARSRAERRALVRAVDTRFVDRTSWGVLFNLFLYESETDLVTGEERSHIRLFWLFEFGDPIRDAGV
ncbi:hypothetical protein OAX78_03300, partial [Planctomycetota bacterium]|nr:hypothetical protein [Planctomycetota bacterium]